MFFYWLDAKMYMSVDCSSIKNYWTDFDDIWCERLLQAFADKSVLKLSCLAFCVYLLCNISYVLLSIK